MSQSCEEPYGDFRKCLRAAVGSVLAGSPVPIPERERDGSKTFLGGSRRLGVTKWLETCIFPGLAWTSPPLW